MEPTPAPTPAGPPRRVFNRARVWLPAVLAVAFGLFGAYELNLATTSVDGRATVVGAPDCRRSSREDGSTTVECRADVVTEDGVRGRIDVSEGRRSGEVIDVLRDRGTGAVDAAGTVFRTRAIAMVVLVAALVAAIVALWQWRILRRLRAVPLGSPDPEPFVY